jgi:CheY-like chemotaxis protein
MNKALFVDDDILALKIGKLLMQSLGYDVITANSGKEALKKLSLYKGDFDVILLDLMMPDMHGLEVLREIRKNSYWREITVIMQTGAKNEEDMKLVRKLGASIILKPYDKKILKEHLEQIGCIPSKNISQ